MPAKVIIAGKHSAELIQKYLPGYKEEVIVTEKPEEIGDEILSEAEIF